MKDIINDTCKILEDGGTILYPTDTIWGIGCDACNSKAVEDIYRIKHREPSKSLLILVDSVEMMQNYTNSIPEIALQLIEATDKPLTIIYPNAKNVAQNIVAQDGSLGIRIVKDEFCQQVIKQLGRPITSTSANLSGQKPPLGYADINNEIKRMVSYIVPLRLKELSANKSSDIVKVDMNGNLQIIR